MADWRDEIIGVPRSTAAPIIGVPVRRLDGWSTVGLIVPSIRGELGGRRRWSYSLDDLVAGCVVRILEDVHHKHIRTIRSLVDAVRSDDVPQPLAQLRWAVDPHEIFVGFPAGDWYGGKVPGQGVMTEILDLEKIRADARRRARERPAELAGQVTSSRGVMGSKATFAGTRIPITAVHAYMERGLPDSRILAAYPDLRPEDLITARQLAS